ncbi:hypothetical protein JI747_017690 [Chryseobacterium sp. RG1]|uniref:Uncharacterized protein n=1 Tax=Chryseobacterium tagetis TaxID=2801334 RepID=A0ABS8A6C0_9FLAO|nr:hypothetical protein [Chryseobacterium tagetis]MCA6069002.1 hypothetical protein [Chryseobacterium tagetis]
MMTESEISCEWVEESYFTACSSNEHFNGEASISQGGPCKANVQSQLVINVVHRCKLIASTALGDDGTGGGGGTPGSGGGLGGGNEEPEIPTKPNLPPSKGNNNPCEKIKAQRADINFQNKIADLQGKTRLKKETGYIQRANGEYTYKDNASATNQANELSLPTAEEPANQDIIAYLHTHVDDYEYYDPENPVITITKKGFKIFSPADISYFMTMIKNAQDAGRPLGDVYAVLVSSLKNYQIRFTGNQYQIKTFTADQKETFRETFIKYMSKNKKMSLELKFLKFIDESMNTKGVSLYRLNSDGTTAEIKLNADKTDLVEITCP